MNVTDTKKHSRTNWELLERQTDEEIDTSDIPVMGADFFDNAEWQMPPGDTVLLKIEPELLAWFKAQKGDFHQLINAALHNYVEAQEQVK